VSPLVEVEHRHRVRVIEVIRYHQLTNGDIALEAAHTTERDDGHYTQLTERSDDGSFVDEVRRRVGLSWIGGMALNKEDGTNRVGVDDARAMRSRDDEGSEGREVMRLEEGGTAD
jgi:hypothetical protein